MDGALPEFQFELHYLNSNLNRDAPPVMPIDVEEDYANEDILGSVLSTALPKFQFEQGCTSSDAN